MKQTESFKTDKKSFDILKKTFDPEYRSEWSGSAAQLQIFMNIYIKEHYKENLFFIPFTDLTTIYGKKKQGIGGGKNGDVVFIEFLKFQNENYVEQINKKTIKNELLPYIQQYQQSKKRFHFFDMTMILWVGQETRHSVSALYDKKTNQVDFFNTTPSADLSLFNTRLQLFFKEIYGKDVKLNYAFECLKFGDIEMDCSWLFYENTSKNLYIPGPCAIWTLWFLELRLKNKDMSREDIIDKAITLFNTKKNKRKNLLCKVIYDYAVFVDKITTRYTMEKDPKTGIATIEYKKTPKNNRILKMILASIAMITTSAIIGKAIKKKKLKNKDHV